MHVNITQLGSTELCGMDVFYKHKAIFMVIASYVVHTIHHVFENIFIKYVDKVYNGYYHGYFDIFYLLLFKNRRSPIITMFSQH